MVLVEHLVPQVQVLQEHLARVQVGHQVLAVHLVVRVQEELVVLQVLQVHQVLQGQMEVVVLVVHQVLQVVRGHQVHQEVQVLLVHQEHQGLVQVGHQEVLVQVHQVPQELRVEHLH